MGNGFPPKPVYPKAFDSDNTLFLVFNTSETKTTIDNSAWSEEITVQPVAANQDDIWPTNGYANIGGELFYYDAVETNVDGKIHKFKRCLRNLAGTRTKFNAVGTDVRGYVVAEHRTQLVDAILSVESFIGENFSDDQSTLDWRIRNLQATPALLDDAACPDVVLTIKTLENSPSAGLLIEYTVEVEGSYNEFRLEFGDGQFSTNLVGTHRFAPNATVDPVVTISNDTCTIVQSPVDRTSSVQPNEPTVDNFEIPLPTLPALPPFICPPIPVPTTKYNIPPIVFPCLDLGTLGSVSVPSAISIIPPINIPSRISIVSAKIPSFISVIANIPSVITFDGNIPSVITFTGATVPNTITFGAVNIPSIISFTPIYLPSIISVVQARPIPSIISVVMTKTIPSIISFASPPTISVTWGTPPTLSCILAVTCPSVAGMNMASSMSALSDGKKGFSSENQDDFEFEDDLSGIKVDFGNAGIPKEIKLVVPKIPNVQLVHDLPSIIRFEVPEITKTIQILGPKEKIPEKIMLEVPTDFPKKIGLDASNVPKSILLDATNVPRQISLHVPADFPKSIHLDTSGLHDIKIVGIPDFIELRGPSEIKLVAPPDMELVYKGAPIPVDVKVTVDMQKITQAGTCVMLSPCGNPENQQNQQ